MFLKIYYRCNYIASAWFSLHACVVLEKLIAVFVILDNGDTSCTENMLHIVKIDHFPWLKFMGPSNAEILLHWSAE